MNRAFAIVGAVAAAAFAAACNHAKAEEPGPQAIRNFQVSAFQKIAVSGAYEVEVHTGVGPAVSAKGPEKALDELVVQVRGDTLYIEPAPADKLHRWGHTGRMIVSVSAPTLLAAEVAGSGEVRVDKVNSGRFDGAVRGSGGLSLSSLDVKSLHLAISGSGNIAAVTGRAAALALNVQGSGDIDADGVLARTASANVAGSGNVRAQATETAAINIMGSGDVDLRGGARCTINKSGSGEVRCS